jgi:hypothetical protein
MGVSPEDFWNRSANGRAMILMLAQRGGGTNVELVRDACEWLIAEHNKTLKADAMKQGRSEEAAKILAREAVAGIRGVAEGINDRNVESAACQVIDYCFQAHRDAGAATYTKILAWFADQLRQRTKD